MKRCTKCGCEKPLEAFGRDAISRDGKTYACKACVKAYYAANAEAIKASKLVYRATNAEAISERRKISRAANSEAITARKKAYYAAHAEAEKARSKTYRTTNAEACREYGKAYRAANKGLFLAHARRREAAKIQRTPEWADKTAINAIYEQAAAARALGIDCHVDHIIPLRGKLVSGLHVHNNLTIVLAKDNLSKGNRFDV